MDLTRGVPPATLAVMAGVFHPVLFAYLDWPDAPVHVHSATGPITWGGHEWKGVGPLGGVDIPSESMGGVAAVEAALSLIGVPADLDGLADDQIRGKAVEVYLGTLAARPGDGGPVLIDDPVSLFFGTMDVLDLSASQEGANVSHTATVTAATGPSARSMASISHSDEDQRRAFPGDTAGRLVILSYAKAQKLTWPEN